MEQLDPTLLKGGSRQGNPPGKTQVTQENLDILPEERRGLEEEIKLRSLPPKSKMIRKVSLSLILLLMILLSQNPVSTQLGSRVHFLSSL